MVESTDKPSKGLPTAQEVMEKLALAEGEKASQAARKHAARHRRARGRERADRGSGLPLSQYALHGQRPRHQSGGGRLGGDADRRA